MDAKRRKPDALIEDTFNMIIKYRSKLAMVKIENNGLLYLFYDQFIEAAAKRGLSFPYDGVKTDQNKEIKIGALAPKMKQGQLKIHKNLRGLRNEFLAFPRSTTDDQMDAITLALDGLMSATVFSFTSLSSASKAQYSSPFGNIIKALRR
jgi:predicted phage terminase large subunit-like protein